MQQVECWMYYLEVGFVVGDVFVGGSQVGFYQYFGEVWVQFDVFDFVDVQVFEVDWCVFVQVVGIVDVQLDFYVMGYCCFFVVEEGEVMYFGYGWCFWIEGVEGNFVGDQGLQ